MGLSEQQLKDHKARAQTLHLQAEEAKRRLFSNDYFITFIGSQQVMLSRAVFEQLLHPLVNKTIRCCERALQDAQLNSNEMDEVAMVGDSTLVLLVKQTVEYFFGKKVHNELNPDEVVALGTAVQANIQIRALLEAQTEGGTVAGNHGKIHP